MSKRPTLVLTLGLTVATSGCGTLLDQTERGSGTTSSRVYGGVRFDAEAIRSGVATAPGTPWEWTERILGLPFFVADVPISAAADTLLLPITVPINAREDMKLTKDTPGTSGSQSTPPPASPAGRDGPAPP
jgi:uncharacterized protein YceK